MFLYGGDYSPEQWIYDMDIVRNDILKFKQANVNTVTLGMFSWSVLEPVEGKYNTNWLREVLIELQKNDIQVIMGTPTAARPHWLAVKEEETSRINIDEKRVYGGFRQNHCPTAEVFRRYGRKIILEVLNVAKDFDIIHSWHINNEFIGECFCPHCQNKFRQYLKERYGTIEKLNFEWWNSFWSHNYSTFEEIIPPFNHGEQTNTPLKVNWDRFRTLNHIDYYKFEYDLIREYSELPITTNFHTEAFSEYAMNYFEFGKYVDYTSFDLYPEWDTKDNFDIANNAYLKLLINGGVNKENDFYMMETTPGSTNWQQYTILKSDKLHYASMFLQILAGSKSHLYFQLKQSRGSSEKFHGALLNVNSSTESRVYEYCRQFGEYLNQLKDFSDLKREKKVAVYFSWDSLALFKFAEGPRNVGLEIEEFYESLVQYFGNVGENVEFIYDEKHIEQFETIIFPYAYHVSDDITEELKTVSGKKIIALPFFNYANDDDLLNLGDKPYNLTNEFGITVDEFTSIVEGNYLHSESYQYDQLAEVVTAHSATVVESFADNILSAAITKNEYKSNNYYYIAAVPTKDSLFDILDSILGTNYDKTSKVIKANAYSNGKGYQMLVNFGLDQMDLSSEKAVWSTSETIGTLTQYDFAIIER